MKTQIPSNSKIKCTLLSILFSILFIFTALYFTKPIIANAATTKLQYDQATGRYVSAEPMGESGLDGISIPEAAMNGTNTEGSLTPTYTYWAGSSKRSGVICYVIDLSTNKMDTNYKPFILINSKIDENDEYWLHMVNTAQFYLRTGDVVGYVQSNVYQVPAMMPVLFDGSDSWVSNEASVESDLLSEEPTYQYRMLRYWAYYGKLSDSQVNQLADEVSSNKKALAFETVSAQSFFTSSSKYSCETLYGGGSFYGDFARQGESSVNHDGGYVRCFTTEYGFAKHYASKGITGLSGSTLNWKWFQATAGSMILEESEAGINVPSGNTTIGSISSSEAANRANGYGIIITHITLPPIHTYNPPNTPGNTEPPDPGKGTDGDCTIKKLYYTEYINTSTNTSEIKDYIPYTRTSTTNYISIDTESLYQVVGWRTSATERSLSTKEDFESIPTNTQHGKSGGITITLNEPSEKYLYVLLKRTVIISDPPDDWDFRLEQSQITKRVSFLQGNGPATTKELCSTERCLFFCKNYNHNPSEEINSPVTSYGHIHTIFILKTITSFWRQLVYQINQ